MMSIDDIQKYTRFIYMCLDLLKPKHFNTKIKNNGIQYHYENFQEGRKILSPG